MDVSDSRHLFILCFLGLFSYSVSQANETKCDCQTEAEVNKTRNHLRLLTRISALKLLPTVREVISKTEAEKLYFLHRAKYDVLRDLRAHYGNLLAQTDILSNMDMLMNSIRNLLNDNRSLTNKEIYTLVNTSVIQFHTNVLPSAFLCFALGTCRTASTPYMECMRNNVQQWTSFFGDEPLKMAQKVAEAISQYRKVDAILQVLHNSLITAEDEITMECAHRFHNVTVCPKCITDDTVRYCRSSCEFASLSCMENLSEKWDSSIDELYELTRKYDEGFVQLVQGIANGMRRLVQMKAPRLAKVVVNKCGPLSNESNIYTTSFMGSKPQKPQEEKPMTKELVEHMRTLKKCWTQLAVRMCSGATDESYCWNGTNIVKLQHAADDLSLGIKDVRPRPKEAWLESSGHPYDDTDDEDFISGGGGSGSGVPTDDIEDTTVYTIAPVVTTPMTSSSTPTVVVVEQATQLTSSPLSWTSTLAVLMTLLILR